MGYRPPTKSPRKAGRTHRARRPSKAKAKGQKHRSSSKYLLKENHMPNIEKIVEKTLGRLRGLGNQIFAVSPFSEYFDDWLVNLKTVLVDFESNPAISVDDQFVKELSQVISDVELKLVERRREEAALGDAVKRLAAQNHRLVQIDMEYATSTQKMAARRNRENQRITRKIHDLKEELDQTSRMKTGIFSPFARRAKARKMAEVARTLDSVKSELESVVQRFQIEQEKRHDEYEKEKQSVIRHVQRLEREVEVLETDGSVEDRRVACEALVNAVKALLQRKKLSLT